jgi:hypothetical protein
MLDVGDVYPTEVVVRSAAGQPADATAVACAVTAPDGTTTHPPVQHAATGTYRSSVLVTAPGLWSVVWTSTGLNAASYAESFAARDPAAVPVVSLAEAKAYLNIAAADSDDELRGFIDAVTAKGEEFTGRVFGRRTVSADVRGSRRGPLQLPVGPVLSIVGITADGEAVDPAGVVVSPAAATLTRAAGWDYDRVQVVYTGGYAVQPPTDVMGAKMLLRWLWQSQRGSVRRSTDGTWAPGAGWDIPNAVVGQWRDSALTGFA